MKTEKIEVVVELTENDFEAMQKGVIQELGTITFDFAEHPIEISVTSKFTKADQLKDRFSQNFLEIEKMPELSRNAVRYFL